MASKTNVILRIESKSEDYTDLLTVSGQLSRRNDTVFLRYEEEDGETGKTVTTVKVKPAQIEIIRHGGVDSRQSFVAGKDEPGYYGTPHGTLQIMTQTRFIDNQLVNGLGRLRWSYALYISEQYAGQRELTLDIREELGQ